MTAHEKADDMRDTRFARARREQDGCERPAPQELCAAARNPANAPGEPAGVAGMGSPAPLSRPAALVVACVVALCAAVAVFHVLMETLYVAPSNTISRQYSQQIDAWIDPYFDQNWQLFAPDPQSVEQQISARAARIGPHGALEVGGWLDLTAIDEAAVRHDAFPSHTAQNMLRRAWDGYLNSDDSGDQSDASQARMFEEYLGNIAAQRLAAHGQGSFDLVQLRVVTTPIAPSPSRDGDGGTPAAANANANASSVRYLPWWKAQPNDH
jgi:Family of unknown function (DUF5819)